MNQHGIIKQIELNGENKLNKKKILKNNYILYLLRK